MKLINRSLSTLTLLGLATLLGIGVRPAAAAEQVVLRYNFLEASIPIDALTQLAEEGEVSDEIDTYLEMANQDPERLRRVLNRSIEVDLVTLDRGLNSIIGDVLLDEISEYIHTPSQTADREAMRGALILSAEDDNQVSLLEILQNYPTQEVHVNGNELVSAYREIRRLEEGFGEIWEWIDRF